MADITHTFQTSKVDNPAYDVSRDEWNNAHTAPTDAIRKNNFGATTDPTTGDDTGDGYEVGSHWVNTTSDQEWVATDVTLGAALWVATTAGASALTVKDEGSSLSTAASSIDFTGAGVTASGTGAAKTVNIPGISGILGGVAGAPHTGLSGAAAAGPNVAEAGHQHPAQINLQGANIGDHAVKVRYVSHSYDSIQLGLRHTDGVSMLRFGTSVTDGLEVVGPLQGSTGDDTAKLVLTPSAGGYNPAIILNGAYSYIERQGSQRVLWDNQIGLDIAAASHEHDDVYSVVNDSNLTSTTPTNVPGLVTLTYGIPVGASGLTILVKAWLPINTAAATTGISLGLFASGSTSLASYTVRIPISDTAEETFFKRANGQMGTSSGYASGTDRLATIEGLIAITTNGTIAVRYASEVAGSQVSVLAGAAMVTRVVQINP